MKNNTELMVRLCEKCGHVYSDKAERCEECGTVLSAPMASGSAEKMSARIYKRNAKIKAAIDSGRRSAMAGDNEDIDPGIPVTGWRIVVGVVACVAFAGLLVTLILYLTRSLSAELYSGGINAAIPFIISLAPLFLLPIIIWDCFAPNSLWIFSHSLDHIHYREMPLPSDLNIAFRQIFNTVIAFGSVALLVWILILTLL